MRIGKCHENLGDKDLALKFYRKAIAEDPILEKGWLAIIDLYAKDKNYKRALNYVNKSLDIDGENEQYWRRFASLNYALENYEEAYKGYEKSILLGSVDLDVFLVFSDMNMIIEKYEEAIEVLVKAMELHPNNYEIEYRLAGLHFILKNQSSANFHFNNALIVSLGNAKLFSELFPDIYKEKSVQKLIEKHKK